MLSASSLLRPHPRPHRRFCCMWVLALAWVCLNVAVRGVGWEPQAWGWAVAPVIARLVIAGLAIKCFLAGPFCNLDAWENSTWASVDLPTTQLPGQAHSMWRGLPPQNCRLVGLLHRPLGLAASKAEERL